MSINNNRGNSLIGVLISVVIILAAVLYFAGMWGNRSSNVDTNQSMSKSQKTTTYGQAMDSARAIECQSNIGQLRQAINMYIQANEAFPASLNEVSVPDSMKKCSMTKELYIYDLQTGRVMCPTHTDF